MPQTSDSERPLAIGDVADLFGVSTAAVRDWADRGQLRSFRTPGGQRRFLRADVEAFLLTPASTPVSESEAS